MVKLSVKCIAGPGILKVLGTAVWAAVVTNDDFIAMSTEPWV